jgi:hypothetical protein
MRVLFYVTFTQVVLLLITSTFTWVQIQSNLGTTELTAVSLKAKTHRTRFDNVAQFFSFWMLK